jgi:GH24 family phage-related lysozyme (muramidase)
MTDTTTASAALIPFTARHEGKVHKAYRDSGGVVTIGIGFTGLSKVFAEWWLKTRGHRLKMGDIITDAECDLLLGKLIEAEYAPPVAKRFAGTGIAQHEFDTATDMSFNCGPGALKWQWATALAGRQIATAAAKLRTTAVTAGGKTLTGLKRRRAAEARLMESGDYGTGAASVSTASADVKAYQIQLTTLGLYTGAIDGKAGKGSLTEGAVMNFQRANGLIVDGEVGPATRAALARAVEARAAGQAGTATTAGGAAAGGGAEAAQQGGQIDWSALITGLEWGLAIGAVLLVAYLVWRYRGVILRKRTAA